MYKQVRSASVGVVLQHEWEVINREDPHMVAVAKDGLLLPRICVLLSKHLHIYSCELALIRKICKFYIVRTRESQSSRTNTHR